jgi:hypothetical protein
MKNTVYCGNVGDFLDDMNSRGLLSKVADDFKAVYGSSPGESEERSWRNSWPHLGRVLDQANIPDAGILMEYQLPLASQRIDCIVTGQDRQGRQHAVILELKQWDTGQPSEITGCVNIMGRDVLHPSAQVSAYGDYLSSCHSAFVNGQVDLLAGAYLHNVENCFKTVFCSPRYSEFLDQAPVYAHATESDLVQLLSQHLRQGAGRNTADTIQRGTYAPSRALLQNAAKAIEGNSVWKLIDNQLLAFFAVRDALTKARKQETRTVVVVTGGPGTGKSVVALNLVADAARHETSVVHATGSKAFTTNMRGLVGANDRKLGNLFKYFNNFSKAPNRSIDLIVCDEAHRLRETSSTRFRRSDLPQVDEIILASKASVFFLDENQSVRPNEVGTVNLICNRARALGIEPVRVDLNTQFRCAGSAGYLQWLDGMLDLTGPTRAQPWRDEFEFRLFDNPAAMESALRQRVVDGSTARMVAGFCWPWSDPNPNGSLPTDVAIGDWKRPWNRKPPEMNGGTAPPPHKHPYTLWANQPQGFDEVGCIYSAQGFEFDYVGVIWGEDLVWRDEGGWVAQSKKSYDKAAKNGSGKDTTAYSKRLRQTYRVLLSRGMKGCYLVCLDEGVKKHVKQVLNDSTRENPKPGSERKR